MRGRRRRGAHPPVAQNPVFIDSYNYFVCHGGYDDPVCDPCQPLYLKYDNCKAPTRFTLTIPFTMPPRAWPVLCPALPPAPAAAPNPCPFVVFVRVSVRAQWSNFTISLISGHYYPKEIVIETYYNYTSN